MKEYPSDIWRDIALSSIRNLELLLPHVKIGDIWNANSRDAFINANHAVRYFKAEVAKEQQP
jgi:hypothetical protein